MSDPQPSEANPSSAAPAELDILMAEYRELRFDDRQNLSLLASGLGVMVAATAAIVAFVGQFGTASPRDHTFENQTALQDAVWAALPIVPWGIGFFILHAGTILVIRRYYIRSVERSIAATTHLSSPLAGIEFAVDKEGRTSYSTVPLDYDNEADRNLTHLPVPGSFNLLQSVSSPTRALMSFRILILALYLSLAAPIALVTVASLLQIDNNAVLVAGCVLYLLLTLLASFNIYRATFGSRALWEDARSQAVRRLGKDLHSKRR